MTRLRYNLLKSTLGAALDDSETDITFAAPLTYDAGDAVPTLGGGDYIPFSLRDTFEIVWLTDYTEGDTGGTIVRAMEGSTAATHVDGAFVGCGPTVNDVSIVGCAAYNDTGASITNSSEQTVPLPSELFDTSGFHDPSTNNSRITVPAGLAGFYTIVAQMSYVFNGTGTRTAAIYLNGTKVGDAGVNDGTSSSPQCVSVLNLAEGDYVELATYQNSGGTRTLDTNTNTRLTVVRIGAA